MENEKIKRKDTTKEKILLFIIGVLVGAVISTAAFLVYTKTLGASSNTNDSSRQMPGGTPPEMPSGENNQGGTPPEMPNSEDNQGGTPPEMSNGESASNGKTNTSSEKPSNSSNSDNN